MKAFKDSELEKCHSDFLEICFGDFPKDKLPEHVSAKITGYGTKINEKVQSFKDIEYLL